jgi:tRNA(adenine34) deaminase
MGESPVLNLANLAGNSSAQTVNDDRQFGGNRRERDRDPTAHAEILALRQAGQRLGDWQLQGCRLYVTLEPCPMCAGAISQSRLAQVIYGADDPKAGALGSVLNLPASAASFHCPEVIGGVCEAECRRLLQEWFSRRRGSSW